jgi:hypothetical protein
MAAQDIDSYLATIDEPGSMNCGNCRIAAMSLLRIELFFDDEAGEWHYRVPALPINGGGLRSRHDAEQDCRGQRPNRRRLTLDVAVAQAA